MSKRAGFLVSLTADAPSLPEPNRVQEKITVEIRAFWPERMGNEAAVKAALAQAYEQALADVDARVAAAPAA